MEYDIEDIHQFTSQAFMVAKGSVIDSTQFGRDSWYEKPGLDQEGE